jgi:hypothetical protein
MSIKRITANWAGNNHQRARFVQLDSSDTIAVVTAAGYLNNYVKMNSIALYASDFVHVAAKDGTQIYKPVFTNGTPQVGGSVQLVALG